MTEKEKIERERERDSERAMDNTCCDCESSCREE